MIKDTVKRIEETVDYDKFSLIEGNRPFNKGLLLTLEESIVEEGNYLADNPIIVNERLEIIDGQHRWNIAKKLHLPLYYIISNGLGLREAKFIFRASFEIGL